MNVQEFKDYCKHYKKDMACVKKDKWLKYHKCYCGFDIETTALHEHSYMYIWQFSFATDTMNCVVVFGRTWGEFIELINFIKKRFCLRETTRFIIWVANLGYEFSFMRHYLKIEDIFAKTARNPLIVDCGGLEFREALSISQGSLAYLAKTWTKTQKAIGDLDYNIIRNSKTPLTNTEMGYCSNDVVILSEFSKRIFDDYIIPEYYIPITSTAILRHDLKKNASNGEYPIRRVHEYIKGLFPPTKEDYIYIMQWLFRGGYVHSNHRYTNVICRNMHSFDLKSSYPAVAFQCYYPVTLFRELENVSRETLEKLCEEYCVIFQARFRNLKATTSHSIESKSKCIVCENAVVDNGRIFECENMVVFLTELDYETYKEFYTWDSMEIITCHISNRGYLPKYLLDRFYYWFEKKESIEDKNSQEYAITKTRINGHYGLCVTKLCFDDVKYIQEEDKWDNVPSGKSYEKLISKEVLSPYWGIYICCHARRRELMLLYKMQSDVVYSDTDSHKVFDTENVKKVVSEYNTMIDALNRQVCEKYGYDYNILKNIGKLECETEKNPITEFKTLGAKRYVTKYADGDFSATVSGLPKKSLERYCRENDFDIMDIFENDLIIPYDSTHKLVSIYCDYKYSDIVTDEHGNSEIMKECSGVYLKPSDFHLSMEKDYIKLLEFWVERIEKYGY